MTQRPLLTNFSAGEVSPKFFGRFDLEVYGRGVAKLENWIPATQGLIATRPPTKYLGESLGNIQARYIPFVVGTDAFEVELTSLKIRIWKGDTLLLVAPVDPIVSPYTAAEIPYIQYAKSANQLYLVQRNHPIQILTYEGLQTFSLAEATITFGTDVAGWVASTAYADGDVVMSHGVPHRVYKCISAGTSGTTEPSAEDEVIDGTVTWNWEFTQPFSQEGDYPGTIAYFSGRMWYGGMEDRPDTVIASLPYDFERFDFFDTYSYTGVQLKDASLWASPDVPETETLNYTQTVVGEGSAIEFQLASENDESVMWLAATDFLVIGTGTSEWIVTKDVTALNIDQCVHLRSRLGSYEQQAMVVGEKPVFLQGTTGKAYLWEYAYNAQDPELSSTDLTYLADHMLEAGVSQADFASFPQTLWLGVTDGKLAQLLYSPRSRVAAWFWLVTDGTVLSVCVVPGTTEDAVYLQVLRNSRYCFERLETAGVGKMLDSYVAVPVAVASTTGLERFNGETVSIYNATHGTWHSGTVAAGALDTTLHVGDSLYIGLPYTCSMKSLPLRTASSESGGSGQGKLKRIVAVTARVLSSYPFKAGYSNIENLEAAKTAADIPWTEAYSGDVRIPFQGKWGTDGYLWIVQDKPQATTILALIPEVDG